VKVNTLKPVWNEIWQVKNVPVHASLAVEVLDKDDGAKRDDYIGKFSCSVSEGAKECEIDGPIFRRAGGTFWLKVRIFSLRPDFAPNASSDRQQTLREGF
jgi:hypothetical protein